MNILNFEYYIKKDIICSVLKFLFFTFMIVEITFIYLRDTDRRSYRVL